MLVTSYPSAVVTFDWFHAEDEIQPHVGIAKYNIFF